MSQIIRAALTQTRNVYPDMPTRTEDLDALAPHLDALRESNLAHHAELITRAAAQGARIIGLGELFSAPYFALERRPMWRELAEDALSGPSVNRMRELARQNNIVIVAPIYELDARSGRRFNTAVIIESDGELLGTYRKTHIPKGQNESGGFDELFYYEPSDGGSAFDSKHNISKNAYFPVFQTSVAKVGVAICYDRHFEGTMRSLASGGAEIIFSPAVTFGAKAQQAWSAEFITDAIRHNIFIAGSNRLGTESPWQVNYQGQSYFAGPHGRLDEAGTDSRLVTADLDLSLRTQNDPAGWALQAHRRPDIYSD